MVILLIFLKVSQINKPVFVCFCFLWCLYLMSPTELKTYQVRLGCYDFGNEMALNNLR